MSLIGLIIVLIVIGFALYCVNSLIPMDPKIKTIINIVIVLVVLLFIFQSFGLLSGLDNVRIR